MLIYYLSVVLDGSTFTLGVVLYFNYQECAKNDGFHGRSQSVSEFLEMTRCWKSPANIAKCTTILVDVSNQLQFFPFAKRYLVSNVSCSFNFKKHCT